MIPTRITDSDSIILQSVESYLKDRVGVNPNSSPQEKLIVTQQARDYLYSDIVQRFPRVAAYILQADLEKDTFAQGLNFSLAKHVMDPAFINMLMQYLATTNNAEQNCISGAYLCKLMSKWLDQHIKLPADKKKATDRESVIADNKETIEQVAHIRFAVNRLLGTISEMVHSAYPNLMEDQCTAIAASLAMNNSCTICEIVASDFPVTADVLDIISPPDNFIRAALLLEKDDLPGKPTTNQQAFLDSLVRWTFGKLNSISTQQIYQFMVSAYGTNSANVQTKFINPRSCGNLYHELKIVAEQIINKNNSK